MSSILLFLLFPFFAQAEEKFAHVPSSKLTDCLFYKLQSEGLKNAKGQTLQFANCMDEGTVCSFEPFFGQFCRLRQETTPYLLCAFEPKGDREEVDPLVDIGQKEKGPGRKGRMYCHGVERWVLTREPGKRPVVEELDAYAKRKKPTLRPLDREALKKKILACLKLPAAGKSLADQLPNSHTPTTLNDVVKIMFPGDSHEYVADFVAKNAQYTTFSDGVVRFCQSLN